MCKKNGLSPWERANGTVLLTYIGAKFDLSAKTVYFLIHWYLD